MSVRWVVFTYYLKISDFDVICWSSKGLRHELLFVPLCCFPNSSLARCYIAKYRSKPRIWNTCWLFKLLQITCSQFHLVFASGSLPLSSSFCHNNEWNETVCLIRVTQAIAHSQNNDANLHAPTIAPIRLLNLYRPRHCSPTLDQITDPFTAAGLATRFTFISSLCTRLCCYWNACLQLKRTGALFYQKIFVIS